MGEREAKKLFNAKVYGKALRHAQGRLSVRELGKLIGISHATACRVLNGKPPNIETYLRINRWLFTQPYRPRSSKPQPPKATR